MEPTPLSLAVSAAEFKSRVADEFFLVARESAVGAFLTVVVVMVTHWTAQPLLPLMVWVVVTSGALVLRAVSAHLYIQLDAASRKRWYPWCYGAQWVGFIVTAVVWVLSLSMLGSGELDTLFHVRTIFVIAVLSLYVSAIGIDRWLYACFVLTMVVGFWLDLVIYYPQYLIDMPSTPVALALYGLFLLARSRSEQRRLHASIKAQMAQSLLLKELSAQANRDALTGTNNRGHIESELRRLIKLEERRPKQLSVLLLDVDHFKRINDTHGHDAGDVVLRQLVQTAQHTLRDTDILGRWGGEEFLAILPDTDVTAAMEVAERLRLAMADMKLSSAVGQPFQITVSIGVAQHRAGETSDIVTKHADLALYVAKEEGRNRCRRHGV